MIGTVVVGAAFYILGRYLGIEVQVEAVDEKPQQPRPSAGAIRNGDEESDEAGADEEDDAEDDDADEDVEALLFLPTGFSRPKPQTFYRGSDPEWQEFTKLSKDKARAEKIRGRSHDGSLSWPTS
jgi:hypothetical protein